MLWNLDILVQPSDDRAVSPVIGVVLMVAITVILAAVIGTFVLDMGRNAGQTAPQASLSVTVDASTNNITIEHTGGDAVDAEATRVVIEHANGSSVTFDPASSSTTLSVGGSVQVSVDGPAMGDAWRNMTTDDEGYGIEAGQRVEVTVIDTQSQRQIFETTVTA